MCTVAWMGVTGKSNAWLEGAHAAAIDWKRRRGGTIAMLNVCKCALSSFLELSFVPQHSYLKKIKLKLSAVLLHAFSTSVTQFTWLVASNFGRGGYYFTLSNRSWGHSSPLVPRSLWCFFGWSSLISVKKKKPKADICGAALYHFMWTVRHK